MLISLFFSIHQINLSEELFNICVHSITDVYNPSVIVKRLGFTLKNAKFIIEPSE